MTGTRSLIAMALTLGGAVGALSAATSQVVSIPDLASGDKGKEVSLLLDEDHLKLATIALRDGTVLTTHAAPVAATIVVIEGTGIIHMGDKAVHISKGSIVSLAPQEEHDVVPDAGTDMLLLVHYLKNSGDVDSPHATHDH